jgi:hypothetical protein
VIACSAFPSNPRPFNFTSTSPLELSESPIVDQGLIGPRKPPIEVGNVKYGFLQKIHTFFTLIHTHFMSSISPGVASGLGEIRVIRGRGSNFLPSQTHLGFFSRKIGLKDEKIG